MHISNTQALMIERETVSVWHKNQYAFSLISNVKT